ncbi:MAG: CAAX prenyl protease-related protein [Burkholderiales bacterium]|jgi:hypothetical protein|nr:CAAX prenyl protease-related protein [Burkholderiales bacterium]
MTLDLAHPAVARSIPFALYIVILAIGGEVPDTAFDTRWLYPVQAGLVAVALAVLWKHYAELRRPGPTSALHVIAGLVVGAIVFVLWIAMVEPWMVFGEMGKGYDPRDGDTVNVALAAFRIAGAALVVPVMEELFWRSFVMRWIDRQDFLAIDPGSASLKAVVVSSVIFAVEHHQWLAGIVAGVAYAGLYRLTRNLWIPVIAHAATNAMLGAYVLYTGRWYFW